VNIAQVKIVNARRQVDSLFNQTIRADGYLVIRSGDELPVGYHLGGVTHEDELQLKAILEKNLADGRKTRITFLDKCKCEIGMITTTPPSAKQ
jgi:hypothetical protein